MNTQTVNGKLYEVQDNDDLYNCRKCMFEQNDDMCKAAFPCTNKCFVREVDGDKEFQF